MYNIDASKFTYYPILSTRTEGGSMDVELIDVEPLGVAIQRLRQAPLEKAGEENIFTYRDASVMLQTFYPDMLNPTSLYALRSGIEFQRALRYYMLENHGIDTLALEHVLHLRSEGQEIGMAPPFVEYYDERVQVIPREGDNHVPAGTLRVPILLDGIHRAMLARELHVPINCIVAFNTNSAYLPYAYPNSWDDVQVYNEVPEVKKYYRRKEHYSFMRPVKTLLQIGDGPPPETYGR